MEAKEVTEDIFKQTSDMGEQRESGGNTNNQSNTNTSNCLVLGKNLGYQRGHFLKDDARKLYNLLIYI